MPNTKQTGSTLVELTVVVFIISVLFLIAIRSYTNLNSSNEYIKARLLLTEISLSVKDWKARNSYYPDDIGSSEIGQKIAPGKPQDRVKWLSSIPFDSVFDYDHWPLPENGRCYVHVAFWGQNKERDYELSQIVAQPQELKKVGDDLVLGIDIYDCECTIQETIRECWERTGKKEY
ncbi:MAG: hypothetical protein F6K22_19400 [Okeania sp. SIO2F4]|uniref:type II secretion system protein n=1 Tax=Okeania sp. SIO2F4 TaxID=2607790 RepID=UPI00142A88BE|nr:prepilin-type N-terminal cleavage/methylation domain-containing protein [Okeania sp. SIO2F4]NES04808.1 hypothetical protein [Okeania sp. SIO2F4]